MAGWLCRGCVVLSGAPFPFQRKHVMFITGEGDSTLSIRDFDQWYRLRIHLATIQSADLMIVAILPSREPNKDFSGKIRRKGEYLHQNMGFTYFSSSVFARNPIFEGAGENSLAQAKKTRRTSE